MAYTFLAGVIIVAALLLTLFSGRMLLKGTWLLGWLRGMFGLVLLAGAVLLALSALDFYGYQQLTKEQSIATISFTKNDYQDFQVSLVDSNGKERLYDLKGDLWQLDARIIKWSSTLAGIGLKPGYRLDRLNGRYYSLEEEKNAPRTVYELDSIDSKVDVWQWLREHGGDLSIVDASYGSATYLPMEDGALFSVTLTNTGLISRPLNDRAKAAVAAWQ